MIYLLILSIILIIFIIFLNSNTKSNFARLKLIQKFTFINKKEYNILKYFYLKDKTINEKFNKPIIFQTYNDKEKIPKNVFDNIKNFAKDNYLYCIYDDNEVIEFLNYFYHPIVKETFLSLKMGAHKADLARYCFLYIYGGIYLDIKTELIMDLKTIFNDENCFYSVIGNDRNHIYQGVIASPKNHPLFLYLINHIVYNINDVDYLLYTKYLYLQIKTYLEKDFLNADSYYNKNYKFTLFQENCSNNSSSCYDGLDRYNLCCYIYDKNNIPIIKSRRSNYPFH
jgi:hypothetical protein